MEAESDFITGKWTQPEHIKFIEAYFLFGHNWKHVFDHIQTRSCIQIRCHWQKLYRKIKVHSKKYRLGHLETDESLKMVFYELFSLLSTDTLKDLGSKYKIDLEHRQQELFREIRSYMNNENKKEYKSLSIDLTSENLLYFSENTLNDSFICNEEKPNQAADFTNDNTILSMCSKVKASKKIFKINKVKKEDSQLQKKRHHEKAATQTDIGKKNTLFIEKFRYENFLYKNKLKLLKNNLPSSKKANSLYYNIKDDFFRKPSPIYMRKTLFKKEDTAHSNFITSPGFASIFKESPGQSFSRVCSFIHSEENLNYESDLFNVVFDEKSKEDIKN